MKSDSKDETRGSGETDNVIDSVELSDGAMRRIRAMQYIIGWGEISGNRYEFG